jgi:hypothetical protein
MDFCFVTACKAQRFFEACGEGDFVSLRGVTSAGCDCTVGGAVGSSSACCTTATGSCS